MDQLVFHEKSAVEHIKSTFVPFKVVKNEGEYKELASQFNMRGFPTIIVLNPDGTERDRIVGFGGDADLFVKTVTDYANNVNTLSVLVEANEKNPLDVKANFNLAMKYLDRIENRKAQEYFERVVELDPQDEFGHKQKAEFNIALNVARFEQNVEPLEKMLAEVTAEDMLRAGIYILVGVYENKSDTLKVISTYKRGLAELGDNANMMNSAAWFVYENKVKDQYEWGIEIASKAVDLAPNDDSIWDTLAWLQYENGDVKGALASMQKAAALDPGVEYYQENVGKFKAEL